MNSKLRNGLGHNSAEYDVKNDAINYENRSGKGTERYSMSYIRFCEALILLYRQFEVVWLYPSWLLLRVEGITGKIV
jgi:hypothetical protein